MSLDMDCERRPQEGVAGTSEAAERANCRDVVTCYDIITTDVGKASELAERMSEPSL
jgi:hypothetical protein